MSSVKIQWHNPREKIWGFHVHQELPIQDFTKALVIQDECTNFLTKNNIYIDANDAIKPGYGPHLNYMWELRVENMTSNVLEKMGLAISYMAINRFGLSGYIHPLAHNPLLPEEMALAAEGRDNQANAVWFSYRVPQKQTYFFDPLKDVNNKIIDTRTPRIMSSQEKMALFVRGKNELKQAFQDPENTIINGFHIHLDYLPEEKELALEVYYNFITYLLSENMSPTSTRLYGPGENGPHIQGGWEVKFETKDKTILNRIGIAIGWLMCNRQGFSIFMHPATWEEGHVAEELHAHEKYCFFIGELPQLNLRFFSDQLETVSI